MELALQTALNGLAASCFYMIVAVGLAMIFGVMHMVNFAHGEFFMVGAYAVWLLYQRGDWSFPAAVLVGIGVVLGLGLLSERAIFRPVRGKVLTGFIISVGLLFILQVAVGRIWGVGLQKPVSPPLPGALELFGASIGRQRFVTIPITLISLGGLWFFLRRVKLGRALRATAQDPDAAALQGISINRMSALAMGIAAAFAGLAGGIMSPIQPVTPYMGHMVILTAFIVIIIGGLGSIEGAVIASFALGFLHTIITTLYDFPLANMVGVIFMLVILAIRPQGLLGREKL